MPDDANPRFSGVPSTPAPEVFERARSSNPAWYQILEQAYATIRGPAGERGHLCRPQGSGATIEQIWLVHTLFGIEPYCLLARSLPAEVTQRITRLVNCKAAQIVESLKAIQTAEGAVNVPLAYHDGRTGHCIRVTAYDGARDRFVYHDPWPERSLLAKENNAAGIDAQPEGTRWSVTARELELVAFAAFVFPSQWARVRGENFNLSLRAVEGGRFLPALSPEATRRAGDRRSRTAHLRARSVPAGHRARRREQRGGPGHARFAAPDSGMDHRQPSAGARPGEELRDLLCPAARPGEDIDEVAAALWSLRDPRALLKAKETDPNTSDAIRCVHAFMGSLARADLTTDFSHLAIAGATLGERTARSIEISLA